MEHLATNRYFDLTFDCDAVKVLPGEYFVTTPTSCWSPCWVLRYRVHPRSGPGAWGMNHFMLPETNEGSAQHLGPLRGVCNGGLAEPSAQIGRAGSSLEAKVFGGGKVFASLTQAQVGEKNAQFVLDYLDTERIPIVAQDLLDIYPRKQWLFPASGRAAMKTGSRENDTAHCREREYEARLRRDNVQGDVELFG